MDPKVEAVKLRIADCEAAITELFEVLGNAPGKNKDGFIQVLQQFGDANTAQNHLLAARLATRETASSVVARRAFRDTRTTETADSTVSRGVQRFRCCACGQVPATCVRILRTQLDADALACEEVVPSDFKVRRSMQNYIPLCGTKGARGTCHDAFVTGCMCFVPERVLPWEECDATEWLILLRDRYAAHAVRRLVTIPTNPPKALLHNHAQIMFFRQLTEAGRSTAYAEALAQAEAQLSEGLNIVAWLAEVTPAGLPSCRECASESDLHAAQDEMLYCARCWVNYGGCDICDAKFRSMNDVPHHFEGRKHQSALKRVVKRSGRLAKKRAEK